MKHVTTTPPENYGLPEYESACGDIERARAAGATAFELDELATVAFWAHRVVLAAIRVRHADTPGARAMLRNAEAWAEWVESYETHLWYPAPGSIAAMHRAQLDAICERAGVVCLPVTATACPACGETDHQNYNGDCWDCIDIARELEAGAA